MGVENAGRRPDPIRTEPASMGPRHDGRGKRLFRRPDRRRQGPASMGPRHDGRGKRDCRRRVSRPARSFNGATPRWAWKTRPPPPPLAPPQGFNGATPRWAWKTYQAIMQRYGLTQLQWGHATMGVENAVVEYAR